MSGLSDQIKDVCKIGKGADCCKYLMMGGNGFECAKITSSGKKTIDDEWATNEHVSQGDNCKGKDKI